MGPDFTAPGYAGQQLYVYRLVCSENGNGIHQIPILQILSDQTYRARFAPVGGDDGILCIPDGTGSIGNDGMGQIQISGANGARNASHRQRRTYYSSHDRRAAWPLAL